jgi:argininosuccinate lyase
MGIDRGRELQELTLEEMQEVMPEISEDVFEELGLEKTLASKSAIGGTSPDRVHQALKAARESFDG